MSEQCHDTLRCDPGDLRQCMSIHTRKITDSCRDKDCIEDLRQGDSVLGIVEQQLPSVSTQRDVEITGW